MKIRHGVCTDSTELSRIFRAERREKLSLGDGHHRPPALSRLPPGKCYRVICVGKAFGPVGENWKRMSHSLGTLCPPISGGAKCQRRAAVRTTRAHDHLI